MTTETKKCAIGIDLGTTYSVASVRRNNETIIIANTMGNRTTPSYVAFNDNERLIGEAAKNQAAYNTLNTVFDAKRLIGRKYTDQSVQEDKKHWPFQVLADSNNQPLIHVDYMGERKKFKPEEISAMILGKLKEEAETFLGHKVTDAVITVPAYFNDAQRNATKDAGTIAGLNVLRIINEPTAAAIAYNMNQKQGSQTVLIYDLGGGTLDVSLLEMDDGVLEVKAVAGDNHLGGEDLDNKIVDHLMEQFVTKKKLSAAKKAELYASDKSKRRLRSAAENAKRTLSSTTTANVNVDSFYDGVDLNLSITRAKFVSLCQAEFARCIVPIDKVLKDAGKSKTDVDEIVFVGGSTRIPEIERLVKQYFNGKEPRKDINPDEAIAYGAAVQAAILSNTGDSVTDGIVILDVTPLSLGIETAGGVMTVLIERNHSIPCHKEQVFSTYSDNQPSATILIYEGERAETRNCTLLGKFELQKIPPMPRGKPKLKVRYDLDANGILTVTASEENNGSKNSLVITNNKDRNSRADVERMIKEAEIYAEADKKVRERIEIRNTFENYVQNLRTSTDTDSFRKNVGLDNYQIVQDAATEGIQWFDETTEETTHTDYLRKQKEIERLVIPILTDNATKLGLSEEYIPTRTMFKDGTFAFPDLPEDNSDNSDSD